MADYSNLRIAAVSAGVTLLLSGVVSIAIAFPNLVGPSIPPRESAPPMSEDMSDHAPAPHPTAPVEEETLASVPQSEPEPPAPPMPTDVDCSVEKCVALTFDDGPDEKVTPRILATLRQTGTPATFFHMGKHIAGNEALVMRAVNDGHAVGTHTWNHPQLPLLSREEIAKEIVSTKEASQAITGLTPTLMRPPYGLFNDTVIDVVSHTNDAVIMWDVDTEDWKNKNAKITADLAVNNAHRGAIILMHDVHPTTADALPQIIERLRKNGYTPVTIPTLLGELPPGSIHYSGESYE